MSVQRRVRLADVAARAGVSRTTASYVLNGTSAQMRISAETEQRVRSAVMELGYRRNRSALSLRTATTQTIGVISDFVATGHFASQMLRGASAAARAQDHLIVIGETEGDPAVEIQMIEEMLDRQVDGIIYTTLVTAEVRVPAQLRERRAVLLNCVDPVADLPAVLPDELAGGRSAADVLLAAGAGERVYVVGEEVNPHAIAGPQRVQGVEEALATAGTPLAGVVPCFWDVEPAYEAVTAWLATDVTPTALVCLNDRIAMGTYQALAAHGLQVPSDVSIISFDGSELAGWLRPALTSVRIPYAELGALAVQTLLDPTAPTTVLRSPMTLLHGGSVSSARGYQSSGRQPTRTGAGRALR
ncbi:MULTISPECIES: LacI family DNA-binding transcriptional regulator [Nocardioides]|uniref:LacI family DNA-binding transcriptional regulator n=1 Tax=Nocardioides vastitatis TaxID=2568655 RepID=A0ABW0Z9R6_9ACTN|nr:LacI family DNA-binding transcriptional regulator [Nocardioides sp.]THI99564.1 LacI family DNA-binding transcriptional regulator [Nocardioides sp.]